MREDTEDNTAPNLRQEFLEVKIVDLDSSHCPIIKLATSSAWLELVWFRGAEFV